MLLAVWISDLVASFVKGLTAWLATAAEPSARTPYSSYSNDHS